MIHPYTKENLTEFNACYSVHLVLKLIIISNESYTFYGLLGILYNIDIEAVDWKRQHTEQNT
jgi:hypothetical protein